MDRRGRVEHAEHHEASVGQVRHYRDERPAGYLVTEAVNKIGAVWPSSGPMPASVLHIDDRAALKHMRDVLAELT